MSVKSTAKKAGKYVLSVAFAAAVEHILPVIVTKLSEAFHKWIDAGAQKLQAHAARSVERVHDWGHPGAAPA